MHRFVGSVSSFANVSWPVLPLIAFAVVRLTCLPPTPHCLGVRSELHVMLGSVSSLHKRCNGPKLSEMSKRNNNHKEYYRKPLCLYGTLSSVDSQMVCVSARPKLHIMSEIEVVFTVGQKER